MIRLFISLYLVIIIGLLTINWGSEFLWRQYAQHDSSEIQHVISISRALPTLLNDDKKLQKQFASITGIPLSVIETDDIAWLAQQEVRLDKGEAIVVYDHNDRPLIYIKSNNNQHLLQLGPLPTKQTDTFAKYAILFISHLLLALFISLWIQPVWRDLRYLKSTAAQVAQNNFNLKQETRSHSPISGVVTAINNMASKILSLLSEQKQLINAVSHELRTPLARLRFSLALVEGSNKEQSDDINQDISEIESLIDEMLNYSRLEHISQELTKSRVNVSELLINQVEKLQRGTNIELKANIDDKLICFCQGELLERACQNLITNAIRHAQSKVVVTAACQQQVLTITVNDDGQGISPENRKEIFNPFYRLDKSRNKSQGGFGLGLAIVKKAIDWHRGNCQVTESTLGGAEFTVSIPQQKHKN